MNGDQGDQGDAGIDVGLGLRAEERWLDGENQGLVAVVSIGV